MSAISTQSDSSSSHIPMEEEQPSFAVFLQELQKQISEEQAKDISAKLIPKLLNTEGEKFMEGLKAVQKLIIKGYGNIFINEGELTKKLMKQFSKFSYQLEKDPKSETRMILVLSIIAEMIKQVPSFKFPFRIKFLKNFFLIDRELLELSPYKNNILAILAVIYENLSSQPRLLKTFKFTDKLKSSILENYSLNEEIFSIRLFNKAIYNLLKHNLQFTQAEIRKYGLVDTVSKFISKAEKELVNNHLNLLLIQNRKATKVTIPTIIIPPKREMIAE